MTGSSSIMSWTCITLAFFSLLFLFQAFVWKRNAKTKRLPPGPRGFPIFGCLHLLGKYPHRDLHKLAQKYGSIMHLRLGLKPSIVVSSPQAAELFLRTHDLVFASRPPVEASKYISYNQMNIIYAPYGSYWRTVRKMCTLELLSNHKINYFRSIRNEEVDLLIDYVKEAACGGGGVVDLSAKVGALSADMTCRMVFGKKYMDKEFHERGFKAVIEETMEIAAAFNLADYIPQISSLDLQGLKKRMKAVAKVFDEFFEKVIDEHIQSKDENRTKDFVDLMLSFMGSEETEYRIERDHIKAILLDMLAAAMDTSAATIEWALSELIKYPRIMKKVQKELENVVGKDRMVEESDLDNLEYLNMVIKETFRIHPVVPFLIHESREDCTVNGFHIPNKSRIFINTWAIGRDQNTWNDPEKFFPERFMESNIDLRGHNFELIPFGSGRRSCPGMQLGLIMVRLVIAQLMHCFNWELPDGMVATELDMTEQFGVVMSRTKHLWAIPTCRLNK